MVKMNEIREQELLDRLKDNDTKAFEQLFHLYYKSLCIYARGFVTSVQEAEDLVKDGYLKFWNSKKEFTNLDHVKATLYLAVKQIAINANESYRKSLQREAHFVDSNQIIEDNHLGNIIFAEAMSELHTAIQSLPPQARAIIVASYLEDKSNEEIAKEFNLHIQTVKNHKYRALQLLRQILHKETFYLLVCGVLQWHK